MPNSVAGVTHCWCQSARTCLQVLLTVNAKLFDKLPFLKDKHPQFLEMILPLMKLEFYAANEYVVWQDDMSTEMYFVVEGMLEVRTNIKPKSAAKEEGAFFGSSPALDRALTAS